MICMKVNGETIVKTPSESNAVVQPRYVDLTSSCPVEENESNMTIALFPGFLCFSTLCIENTEGLKTRLSLY